MKTITDYSHTLQILNDIQYDFIAMGSVRADQDSWKFPDFYISFNKLYYMREGELMVREQNEDGSVKALYRLKAGRFYFIPANHRYDFYTNSWFEKFFAHVAVPMIDGKDLFSYIDEVLEFSYDQEKLNRIEEGLKKDHFDAMIEIKTFMISELYKIMKLKKECIQKRLDQISGFSPLVLSVMDYLNKNSSAGLKISEISEQFSMSSQTLSGHFREEVGIGLKKYMNLKLIENSKLLILKTDLSMKEIADSMGFSDPYNFSRFFKTYTQWSPKEFRKMYTGIRKRNETSD